MLKNGTYRTPAGSVVKISGKHNRKSLIEFDWLEEDNACCDCYPEVNNVGETLEWFCDDCLFNSAPLTRCEEQDESIKK